jgi:hypothetical protein
MNPPCNVVLRSPRRCRHPATWLLLVLACAGSGCAALSNPVAEGVPVHRLSPELLAPARCDEVPVPPALLTLPPPDVYRLAPGDMLGVWVDGIFPGPGAPAGGTTPPPVHLPPPTEYRDPRRLQPAAGYPVAVEEDGTISLPRIPPVAVAGLSVAEAQRAVRQAYTVKTDILKAGTEKILVTLLQPRRTQVMVLRQEHSAFGVAPDGSPVPASKLGTGQLVDLPAYKNDVLHALTLTGGLPGLDAYDEVIVQRRLFPAPGSPPPGPGPVAAPGVQVARLPLRLPPGAAPPFGPEDVVLHNGDVVLLQARDCDRFYTGGLLPPGEHLLPRDHDLDVVEAIALVRGPMVNGAFNINNLSGTLIAPGLGNPSPSLLTVLRRTPGGGQVPIRVDLTRALVDDARERIAVQPGDVVILQERPGDALARYFSETFLNFSLTWQLIHDKFITGVFDVSAPERIPARIGITNFTTIPTR